MTLQPIKERPVMFPAISFHTRCGELYVMTHIYLKDYQVGGDSRLGSIHKVIEDKTTIETWEWGVDIDMGMRIVQVFGYFPLMKKDSDGSSSARL